MTTTTLGADEFPHQPWCPDPTVRQSDLGRGWERFRCLGCGAEIKRAKATR